MSSLILVIIIVAVALVYDFLNGANDRANAIATTVATKALTPIKALILAAIFNMLGAFVSTEVAKTVGKGIVLPDFMNLSILLAGVLGAALWTFFCTKRGVPISVSQALIGGMLGAGLAAGGLAIINWKILTNKVFLAIALGPTFGFLAGLFVFFLISWFLYFFFRKVAANKLAKFFRRGQIFTTPFMAFTHGMNDTQNAMGVITAALLAGGFLGEFIVPLWVKAVCGLMMGLGTFLFGWRVMKTIGWRLTKVEPQHGFSAELGAGAVIGIKSLFGMPVSTTHVVCSAVAGGTVLQNWRRMKQLVAFRMIIAWIITIPGAALISGLIYWFVY